MRSGARLKLAALLIGGPILALVALDRAVVHWDAHWAWAAREVPPLTLDPYKLEATLRSTPPGRQNVLILGNSAADAAFDREALEARFQERGLRFPKLTVGGSPALTFGMLSAALAELEPRAAVYLSAAPSLRSDDFLDLVYAYDARAVPELFSLDEFLADPRFHLDGVAGQLHVFARHRRALQRALLVRLGRLSWSRVQADAERRRLALMADGADAWQTWVANDEADVYPNPNTRSLGLLARRLREAGAELVVLDAPVHPIPRQLGRRDRLDRYAAEMERMAAEDGFAWVPQVPQLEDYEFEDWIHANELGRERMTTFLGDYVEENL